MEIGAAFLGANNGAIECNCGCVRDLCAGAGKNDHRIDIGWAEPFMKWTNEAPGDGEKEARA
jgi:hypothetical protein